MSTLELIAKIKKLDPEGVMEVYRVDYEQGECEVCSVALKMGLPDGPDGQPAAILLN